MHAFFTVVAAIAATAFAAPQVVQSSVVIPRGPHIPEEFDDCTATCVRSIYYRVQPTCPLLDKICLCKTAAFTRGLDTCAENCGERSQRLAATWLADVVCVARPPPVASVPLLPPAAVGAA